jgi:hypothetical protein
MIALRTATVAACFLICIQTFAAARCPPGKTSGSIDKYTHYGTCGNPNSIDCGGGRSCPAGSTCLPGGCADVVGTGPICAGLPCGAGFVCNSAAGACYDPRTQYPCGAATCGFDVHYSPGNPCAPCQGVRHRAEHHRARYRPTASDPPYRGHRFPRNHHADAGEMIE